MKLQDSSEVQYCQYNKDYRFRQCGITTCKNHTEVTPHKCLAIDRVSPNGAKLITDVELHHYKLPDANISTKYVSIRRKEAMKRCSAVLTLLKFIEFISEKYKNKKDAASKKMESVNEEKIVRCQSSYPLNLPDLKFQPWMWNWLVSKKAFEEFKSKHGGKGGSIDELGHHDLLDLTEARFAAVRKLVKRQMSSKLNRMK